MNKINTLYLVDDDSIFQFLTSKIIKDTQLVDQLKIFSNGLEAINFLKSVSGDPEKLPEIILLDLAMPIMDGWQFLEEYMLLQPRLGKKIVIYIVSSSIDPSDLQRAASINAVTDYVVKPISKAKLIELIKSLEAGSNQ
ncbi:MAG: response regulator [Cytophagaceae bacterium]